MYNVYNLKTGKKIECNNYNEIITAIIKIHAQIDPNAQLNEVLEHIKITDLDVFNTLNLVSTAMDAIDQTSLVEVANDNDNDIYFRY